MLQTNPDTPNRKLVVPYYLPVLLTLGALASGNSLRGQPGSSPQETKVSKEGLVEALKAGGREGYTEILDIVRKRGVDFELPQACEQLVEAGARPDLLKAARDVYVKPEPPKAPEKPVTPGPPLLFNETLVLLQGGVPLNRFAQMIRLRGVCYQVTPPLQSQLSAAEAPPAILSELARSYRDCRQVCSIPPEGFGEIVPQRALNFDAEAVQGRFDLKLEVDQTVDIVLRGGSIFYREFGGQRPLNLGSEYTQPIPNGELILFDVTKKEGRGLLKLVERSSAANCHSVRIHIEDPKPGTARYHLVIVWRRK